MNPLNWRKINEQKPEHDQECLCKMKHGIISGYYDAEDSVFHGCYRIDNQWANINWHAYEWVPIEEAQ